MKITSFNPLIVTRNADAVIRLFEELGFEKRHISEGTNNNSAFLTVRMKHPDGFYVDISQSEQVPADMTAIRVNVDNLEEAVHLLTERGFVDANGGKVTDLGSSRSVFMRSPSGFFITVIKHVKETF
jgi:hypothetical protein